MVRLKEQINTTRIPRHVAIIMDGNGRWAQQRGHERLYGHQHGVRPIREAMEVCEELGISYLTLYAFSTENWKRPQDEVQGLWKLLIQSINEETDTLLKNNIRLQVIGDLKQLNTEVQQALQFCVDATKHNTAFTLVLALNYGGRKELTVAARSIAEEIAQGNLKPEQVTESVFSEHLFTVGIPDPELLIRTSGESRLSNFLLWQTAYTEFYFTPVLWPDFNKETFYEAIINYQNRERRFGASTTQSPAPKTEV